MTQFDQAVIFAVHAHQNAVRKGTGLPYILHPMEVAAICSGLTEDADILMAAVLHDTVEDTEVTIEEIESKFGKRVADLVQSETENKRKELPPGDTWKIRKQESLEVLKNTEDEGVKILWLGDKLSNIRSFYRKWKKHGNAMWEEFNQKDPKEQGWYYHSIVNLLKEYSENEAWKELKEKTEEIFGGSGIDEVR